MKYRQCRLTNRTRQTTSWLPEKYAAVGRVLKLRDNGVWEDGWVVEWASAEARDEKLLPDWHKEIKGHRQATGDTLP